MGRGAAVLPSLLHSWRNGGLFRADHGLRGRSRAAFLCVLVVIPHTSCPCFFCDNRVGSVCLRRWVSADSRDACMMVRTRRSLPVSRLVLGGDIIIGGPNLDVIGPFLLWLSVLRCSHPHTTPGKGPGIRPPPTLHSVVLLDVQCDVSILLHVLELGSGEHR